MSSIVLALALASAPAASAEPPLRLELLGSPTFGQELGARSVASVRHLVFLYDSALTTRLNFAEDSTSRRVLGVLGRVAKLSLIDLPLAALLATLQHEVFGHGARARELGQWPRFDFALPLPYSLLSPTQRYSGVAHTLPTKTSDQELQVRFSGIEAEAHAAHFAALETARRRGRVHYSDALAYGLHKVNYFSRWVASADLGELDAWDDPDAYALELNRRFNRYGPAMRRETSDRLRRAYVLNFADPMFWVLAYQGIVNVIGRGERWTTVPMLHVGSVGLFPLLRFDLSPFGAEHTLDVLITAPTFALDASARVVSTGFALSIGAGARLFRWSPRPDLELGASLDVWLQPELLPQHRNAFDGRTLPGASGMVEATWLPFGRWGFVAQIGAKSRGYVMSQPLAEGLFGFAGVTFVDESAAALPGSP